MVSTEALPEGKVVRSGLSGRGWGEYDFKKGEDNKFKHIVKLQFQKRSLT